MISRSIRDLPVCCYCGLLDQLLEGCLHSQWKQLSASLRDLHRLKNLVRQSRDFAKLWFFRRVFETCDLDSVSTWFSTCSLVRPGNKTTSTITVYDHHCCNYKLSHPGEWQHRTVSLQLHCLFRKASMWSFNYHLSWIYSSCYTLLNWLLSTCLCVWKSWISQIM